MTKKQSRSVEKVQSALESAGLDTRVLELDQSARTAEMAAAAIGVPLGSIVKSLVLMADRTPVLALVAGDRQVSEERVAAETGARYARLATADEVRAVTGYAVGGVPPVGHEVKIPVIVDSSLSRFETVHAAGGAPRAVFPIRFRDLVRVTGARQARISREEGS